MSTKSATEDRGKCEVVPDLSASLGFTREGARYRTAIEFFYGQGRFTGYRSYGVNVSLGGRGWLGRAGGGSTPESRGAPDEAGR